MNVPREIFGEDYFYFYDEIFAAERSDADAELIAGLLELRPGMRVLDLPCGEGRIAGRLAQRGCDVLGIDSNDMMLDRARAEYPSARFEQADMRAIGFKQEFDAVVNWFTSFGYFDPPTNDRVLGSFARALRPGGRLLVEYHNPWRLARIANASGGSSSYVVERGDDLMVDRITYDGVSRRSVTDRFTVRRGSVRKLQFTLEQVPAPQLVKRLRSAGFGKVELYGAGGAAFDPEGPRLVAVAWRGDDRPEPTVSLEEVDTDNVRDVCDLRLAPGQEPYVAPSAYTVADAHVYGGSWLRAIHAGDTVVGVLALLDDPTPYLVRFMIGAQYQGRGYGRAAIGLLAAHVRDARGASMLQTSCIPGPDSPVGFYTKVGFERTGEVSNGEDVMALRLR